MAKKWLSDQVVKPIYAHKKSLKSLYLRDLKTKIVLTRKKPEKDVYSAILKRAEKSYFKKEIFD